jgi:outer membrane protein assembly factor BamD (BamD/ComL family)
MPRIQVLLIFIVFLAGCQTIGNKGEVRVNHIKAVENYERGTEQLKNHSYQAAISSFEAT